MDCNPYLAIAASLACGLLGMQENAKPREALASDAYSLPHELPRGLHEALDLFQECEPIQNILGESFCSLYRAIKLHESEAFLEVISPWEREHLLLNV